MRRLTLLAAAGTLFIACATVRGASNGKEGSTESTTAAVQTRQVREYTIEEFLATVNYGPPSFSPDKTKLLVSNDSTGVWNAYAIPLAGGEPVQLTQSTTHAIRVNGYLPTHLVVERDLERGPPGRNREQGAVPVRGAEDVHSGSSGSLRSSTPRTSCGRCW